MDNNIYTTVNCISLKRNNKTRCKKKVNITKSLLCSYHMLPGIKIDSQVANSLDKRKIDLEEYFVNLIKNKLHTNVTFLDNKYKHNLLLLKNSWDEVLHYKRVYIDNSWWDLDILLEYYNNLLNSSSMNNPKPLLPCNPFTHSTLSYDDMQTFFKKLAHYKIKISLPLQIVYLNLETLCKFEYNEIPYKLNDLLQKKCRYRFTNIKDSQSCYKGYWVNKQTPLSNFENMYDLYQNIPRQLVVDNFDGTNELVNNPRISQIQLCLDKFLPDEILIINDCEII